MAEIAETHIPVQHMAQIKVSILETQCGAAAPPACALPRGGCNYNARDCGSLHSSTLPSCTPWTLGRVLCACACTGTAESCG